MYKFKFLLLSFFSISIVFSQLLLDDFQNHTMTPTAITSDNYLLHNNIFVSRIISGKEFSFPALNKPLRYISASDNVEPGRIKYNFFTGPLSCDIKPGIEVAKGCYFKFNFSNISKSFFGVVSLSDIDKNKREIHINFFPDQLTYIFNFSTQGKNYGNFDITKVGRLGVYFNIPDEYNKYISDLTIDLDSIEVVPEPFSLLTMGNGAAAFVRKRRKKILNS